MLPASTQPACGADPGPAPREADARFPTQATTLPPVLEAAREEVATACARLASEGLVVGTAGNVSMRVDDQIVVTPTGGVFGEMRAEEMAVVDRGGELVDGPRAPTSE